ncbi:unnamed protein product [Mytilus coruscus]|uniref:Transposase Helix-turn-helix domain-containing protein n=1 Tax=Mytilus coruscus TaxID=42192 RepID=A0A6J8EPF0_MYTCO|nr:unnamed protein product [Mytilus coruscus]
MNRQNQTFALLMMMYMHLKIHALPPPSFFEDEQHLMFLLMISMYQTYLRKIRRPLPFHDDRMRSRILEDQNQDQLVLVDVYSTLVSRPYDFLRLSGETVQSFQDLQDLIAPRMVNFQHRAVEPRNRLLITLIWLRQYPTYPMLSLMFGIGTSTVGDIVNNMWLILWEVCVPLVEWPDINSWRQRIGEWPEMTRVVGSIDGTSHEILIPSNEPQEEFYSGET